MADCDFPRRPDRNTDRGATDGRRPAAAVAVFFSFFVLYLFTLPPDLAPYRDAGEMASSAYTLGVSHPTSYPLYILLGHSAQSFPLGSPAWRLGLFSALMAALALSALYFINERRWGGEAAAGAVVLLGFNATFWSVAQVQEMYTLWVLGAAILMGLALALKEEFSQRLWLGFAAFYGFALSNRLDLLLWAPGILWLALGYWQEAKSWPWALLCFLVFPALILITGSNTPIVLLAVGTVLWRYRGPDRYNRSGWIWRSAAFAALGLSLYAFLPIRSAQGPWLDWNHPAELRNFLDSLLRTKYGGTLDLLSKNYAKGELFDENLILYGVHLWKNFSVVGLAAVLWGCVSAARGDFRRWLGMAAMYWWSGPVFLLMANLPPNPHAAAIVDPHYLLSDLVLIFWAAEGLAQLRPSAVKAAAALGLMFIAPLAYGRLAQMDRRFHFFNYDYAINVFRCVPPGGVVVAKKDVPLYTLWYYQTVAGHRPDIRIVAQGLAGSPWYQAGWRRRDKNLALLALREGEDWKRFIAMNSRVFATSDAEAPSELIALGKPQGLLTSWSLEPPLTGVWELLPRRGRYSYEGQPDFFTSDVVESYAQSRYRQGSSAAADSARMDEAVVALLCAWSMHWLFPEPAVFLGYIEYSRGNLKGARKYYGLADILFERLFKTAESYRALGSVRDNIRRSHAETLMHLGVVSDKLGETESARALYERSLARYPLAQARYNLGVLYWNKDWARVENEFKQALRLDPGHGPAAKYLNLLRSQKETHGKK
ncbi:MAG: hypothetical protein A3J74_05105 [Elusimicrobia bacterium RIFCSPHIGHO2_02_FULL_57_9]|nr:MAG: hypothetical protein A3J74_05105 [Elusimicrobia bacterium RIFCSPHIGHO2_02_FULL_57_9]